MANAAEDIRHAARYVTESNDEDGVAHAIERVLRGEWCFTDDKPVANV